jgi:hypothetical protein
MSGRLSGKVCIITGTAGSVGRAPALVAIDLIFDRDRLRRPCRSR